MVLTDHLYVLLHWHIVKQIKSNFKQKKVRTKFLFLLSHQNEVSYYEIHNIHFAISKFPNVSRSVTRDLSFLQKDAILEISDLNTMTANFSFRLTMSISYSAAFTCCSFQQR